MGESQLSRDDLDALGDRAAETGDPGGTAAALVAAAEAGKLANPADTGYAYLLAAEIYEEADELAEALALVERALTGGVPPPAPDRGRLHACRDRLRAELGYEDGVVLDPYGEDDGDDAGNGDLLDLAGGADLPETGDDAAGMVLLVWSRAAYEQVDQRWPEVLEPTGAETWEDYRDYCSPLLRPGALLVVGDADGFGEWLAEQDTDLYHTNLVALARAYGEDLADRGDPVELPLDPDEPCWCGSTARFGACCGPR